jgi:hypothetical protein
MPNEYLPPLSDRGTWLVSNVGEKLLDKIEKLMEDLPRREIPDDIRTRLHLEHLLSEYKAKVREYLETAVQPFLSAQTLKSRRSVLIAGTVCTAMGFLGIIPNGLPAAGITRGSLRVETVMLLGLVILVFTTVSFITDVMRDASFRTTKLKRLQHQADAIGYRIASEGVEKGFVLSKELHSIPGAGTWGTTYDTYVPLLVSVTGAIAVLLNIFGII